MLDWLGQAAECDAAINEAIEIGERLRDHGVLALAQWSRAWTLGRRGDLAGLRDAVAEVERLRSGWLDQSNGVEFWGSVADQFVALGDEPGLAHAGRRAEELGAQLGYPQAVAMMTARIDALVGDPRAALRTLADLDRSVGAAVNMGWVRQLESAVAALRVGQADAARTYVAQAIEFATAMGLPDLPRRFELPLVERLASVWPVEVGAATADQFTELGLPPGAALLRLRG